MAEPAISRSAGEIITSRRAVTAACVGNAAEWYDFAIYGALATVIGTVYFPAESPAVALSAAFAAYGTALLVRPLGAFAFGQMGDRRGRRSVLMVVIFLMAGATSAVAFLPSYAMIGLLAPIALLVCRSVQGLAAGGELAVSAVFILEHATSSRRGRVGAWHTATMGGGIGGGMVVVALLSYWFSDAGAEVGWWRIAFLIAIPLGFVGWVLRRRITDTTSFMALRDGSGVTEHPVQTVWQRYRGALIRGFCLLAAGSLAFNTFFIFMPNNLIARHSSALTPTLLVTALSLGLGAVAALRLGRLSDRIGRRPVVIASAVALTVLALPLSVVATSGSILGLFLAQSLISVAIGGVISIAMVGELFPTPVRSTGFALSAGLATAVIGGTAPLIDQLLVTVVRADSVPGLYVAVVAAVALAALRRWPETAFASLD